MNLSAEEIDFVLAVYRNPNSKYPYATMYTENGDGLWTTPELHDLIRPTGSYKWVATEKLRVLLVQALSEPSVPSINPYQRQVEECLTLNHQTITGDARADVFALCSEEANQALDPRISEQARDLIEQGRSEALHEARIMINKMVKDEDERRNQKRAD